MVLEQAMATKLTLEGVLTPLTPHRPRAELLSAIENQQQIIEACEGAERRMHTQTK